MLPDYNRLRVFYLVVSAGGVGAAASQLHVTQSAVSQQILKLEAELNTSLFVRLQNRLVPTPEGERLFNVVAPFVTRLEEELTVLNRAREEPFGRLRIGAPVEFGIHYLPKVCSRFKQKHPDVYFEMRLGHPDQLLPQLENGQLDFAFADLFSTRPEQHHKRAILAIEPVMDERLSLIASADYYRTVLKRRRSFRALSDAEFVAYQSNASAIKEWFKFHYGRLPRLKISMTVESVQGVIQSIKAGLGLGVVPRHAVSAEIERQTVVLLEQKNRAQRNRISLFRLLDKHPSVTEKRFVEHMKASLEEPLQ